MTIIHPAVESIPLIVAFGGAALAYVSNQHKHWHRFVLGLLFFLFVFFAFFFFNGTEGFEHPLSLFDVSFNQISLFVGGVMCGSLLMGLYPVRFEVDLNPRFMLYIAGGIGMIMANNLPTFFLFWSFQRFLPVPGFLRDIRNSESSGGGTYIFQHLLTFLCFGALLFYAHRAGVLMTPLTILPASFFTWPVLILSFIIIYQSQGIFPFHSWVHDMVGHLPWYEISAIFLPRAGILLFVQMLLPTLGSDPDAFKILLLFLSIFSSIYWSFRGILEDNVNKETTYFYVAQASLLLTGLQADMTAARGSYLHMMVISISGTALWSILSYIQHHFSLKRSSQFYGLAQYYPKLATLFCLFGFCMIGVPLGASFVVEDLVITGLLAQQPYLGLGHIFATGLNGILFFILFSKIFLGKSAYQQEVHSMDMELSATVPYFIALLTLFLIGLMPFLFLEKLTW